MKSLFFAVVVASIQPSLGWAAPAELECVSRFGHKEKIVFQSNWIMSSYVTVGEANSFLWTGNEQTVSGSDIKLEVELLQNGGEARTLKNLSNYMKFVEFVRDESSWIAGIRKAKLFVESSIFENSSTAKVVVLDSVVLGNQASAEPLDCTLNK